MVQQQDWINFTLQRPNYFPGQYLLDEDFELAHNYLSDRQRYINSKLHLAGIVEGLEVEALAGEVAVTIKPGTALDGEGNLIVLPREKSHVQITSNCWVCLRYYQEPKVLQQPEVEDSFTRFVESPLVTLEAAVSKDATTVILARLTLYQGQVQVDQSVREYSGVRLPSSKGEIALKSDGQSLAIQGDLSVTGPLQFGDRTVFNGLSEQIAVDSDRTTFVPSEKAIKQHIEKRLDERLAALREPMQEQPAVAPAPQADGKVYGWKTTGYAGEDSTSILQLIAIRADVETPRLTIERDTGFMGIGTTTPSKTLEVIGTIRARHLEASNPMRYRIYPNDAIVYQDIFDARDIPESEWNTKGGITKYRIFRNPNNDYETRHSTQNTLWNGRRMLCYGSGNEDEAGALVTIPQGYDTVWVRIPGESWHVIKAQFLDGAKEDLGRWTAGRRFTNNYCPDGSLSDSYIRQHQWVPIPAGRSGQVTLISKLAAGGSAVEFWISGLAFSKNPWAHATQSALGYHWIVNTGNATTWVWNQGRKKFESDEWGGDIFTRIEPNTNLELMVPYIWTGRDKLLYLVEKNDAWNSCMHSGITVNDQPIERLLATYDNPFAQHWNSKRFNRYIAARIPAELIPKPKPDVPPVLRVRVDMRKQDAGLDFREMGTHDLEIPDFL